MNSPEKHLSDLWQDYYKEHKRLPKAFRVSQEFFDSYRHGLLAITRDESTDSQEGEPKYLVFPAPKLIIDPALTGDNIVVEA
jgi:hypothetical protein